MNTFSLYILCCPLELEHVNYCVCSILQLILSFFPANIKSQILLYRMFIFKVILLYLSTYLFSFFSGAFHVCISSINCVQTNGSSLTRNAPSAEWTSKLSYLQRVDAIFLATLLLDIYLLVSFSFLSVTHSTKDGMKYLRNNGKKEKQQSTKKASSLACQLSCSTSTARKNIFIKGFELYCIYKGFMQLLFS